MTRCLLVIACFFVISLNIGAVEIQAEKEGKEVFLISPLDSLNDESKSDYNLEKEVNLQENGKTCSSDSDCFYKGNCTKNGTCSCPKGTNGTLCENVIECMKHPEMCGNATNVKCVFNVESNYASCQCTEKMKVYNHFKDQCSELCQFYQNKKLIKKDCGIYGRCTNSFCWCVKGVSGDFCEKIDQCDKVDCGSDSSATCMLGVDGAYCSCNKPYQVFDETEKICKGAPCRNNSDCMYKGECSDNGTCSCPEGTFGPQCQYVVGCVQNPGMCGNGTDVKCVFNVFDMEAQCTCDDTKKNFNDFIKKCAEPCQKYINHKLIKEDCSEYGRCTSSFCSCVPGSSGDRCEIIDQCESGEVDCTNEPKANCSLGIDGAYCQCPEIYQIFDKKEKICKGEPCKNDSDCSYGGNCTDDGTCLCIKGVGGPLCEQVSECEKNPDRCGNGTDVKCVFNVGRNKADCECDDGEKGFDNFEKKCRKNCESDEDCGLLGWCGPKNFCRCLDGVSGDNCEIIEKCINVDCGLRTNCTLGSDGEARCLCPDPNLGFDYEDKTCKACECGDNSKSCEFHEGMKKCECAFNYFWNGMKCEACNCGEFSKGCELRDGFKECFCPVNYTTVEGTCQKCSCGSGSYHCRSKEGKTECLCYGPYKQRKDKCEFCDCGVHEGECSFTESGKKQCKCTDGFKMVEETGFCTQVCNETNKCQNGGLCFEELCKCREDYTGAWCQTPKWCMHNRCGHHFNQHVVDCVWDDVKKEGRCKCKDPKSFYTDGRLCDQCDCGDHGYCILTELGEKVCICDKGYADHSLKCKYCTCGLESTNCTFDYQGKKLCQCNDGYKQKGVEDAECHRCDCGKHGSCRFGGKDKKEKLCDCEEKYKVYLGACEECNCGPNGFCDFDEDGNKNCTCDFGYSLRNGRCEICDCEPRNMRGIGSECLFKRSGKVCVCPEGYENLRNEICGDTNECLNATACPANTDCLNLPGSYSCHCKEGFKKIHPNLDSKESGCEDIDECTEKPCTNSNTECVNTLGSYDCRCKDGYYSTSSTGGPYYNPKYTACNVKETQWRAASIALGVILSLGILGVGGYIFYLKKGFRR